MAEDRQIRLYVRDLPKGYGLFPLKMTIGEVLDDKDALLTIEFVRNDDGKRVDGVAEILLKNDEFAQTLMTEGLVVKHRGKTTVLNIARHLPDESTSEYCDTHQETEETKNENLDRKTERPVPAPRRSFQQEDEVQRQQHRIECRNVPGHMFNRQEMFNHFRQFGTIIDLFIPPYLENTRKPFVKVKYETHESARLAMQEGVDLAAINHRMYISWDQTEAKQIRMRLDYESNQRMQPSTSYEHLPRQNERPSMKHSKSSSQIRDNSANKRPANRPKSHSRYSTGDEQHLTHTEPQYSKPATRSGSETRENQKTSNRPKSRLRQGTSAEGPSTKIETRSPKNFPPGGRGKSKPAKKPTTRQSSSEGDSDVDDVYSWFDILQRNNELFHETGNRCVLLQTSPADVTNDAARTFFEEEVSATIERIYHIPDGILVVFDSEEDFDAILSQNRVEIDGKKIKVVAKTIPKMYEDRLLLEGSFDGNDDVEALLDCCDIEEDYEIKKLQSSKFLVEFNGDVDIDGILKEIVTTDLEDFNPKAFRVCRTDCVKVNNLAKNVKNDAIKLACMNKKNGGGKVTKVEREGKSKEAIVYFADYEDAERIVDRAESNELLVGKNPVDVSLYFQDMNEGSEISDSSDESSEEAEYIPPPKPKKAQKEKQVKRTPKRRSPVQEFQTASSADVDIILFVRKSKKGFQSLHEDLKEIAELEVTEKSSMSGLDFKFCFKPCIEDLDDDLKYNQQKFEDKCKTVMEAFFQKLCFKSASYEPNNLMNLRRLMLWNEDHDYLKVEVKSNKVVEVYIRWSLTSQGRAKVTGINSDVTAVLDYLKVKCDITEDHMQFQKQHFRALRECNVIVRVEKQLENDVEIKTVENRENGSGKIVFKGPRRNVEEAKAKMNAAVLELTTRAVPDLGSRSEFLLTALKNDERGLQEGMVDVRQIIQAQLDTDKIYASLQVKPDEVCFKYCEVSELEKAQNALTEIIEQKTIEVTDGFSELVNTPGWKRLKQNLGASGSVQVYINRPKSSVDVVGLRYAFRNAFQQINEYIEENVIVTKSFEERWFVLEYLKKHLKSRKDYDKNLKEVKLDYIASKDNPHVTAKGKKKPVSRVLQWLDEITKDLCIKKRDFNEPGMPEYFRSKKGRDQIETISQKNECIGVVDPIQVERSTSSSRGPIPQARASVSVRIPDSNVNLKLLVCDITTVNYDAIVNTSNDKLELRPGGVSGAVLRKGGQSIQQEMNQQLAQNDGKLEVGLAVSTGAGSLPFKRIIHTVGPTWSSGNFSSCQQELRKAVRNCLREATKHNLSSIAIPAISCGVFGGKAATCVPIIVKAIVDFATNNEDGCLREVGLVEMTQEEIKAEFIKSLSMLRKDGDFPSPLPARREQLIEVRKKENHLKLNVAFGDISTLQTDVIVTSTSPQNLAGCSGSAISKALLKQAGKGLQAACHAASNPSLKAGDVVTTPAYNLSCLKVYHVMLSNYNPFNGLTILKKAILKCLDMADKSGHTSIAFPTLGAGGFSFPPNEVVKLFDEVVQSYDGNSLQTVYLVVFNSDNVTIQAIQDELSIYPPPPQPATVPAAVASRNTVQVIVKQGDITATGSKAVVNSTNNFNLSGAVGKALIAKAGQKIVQECANSPISQTPNIRVTSGGNAWQYIIHLATPQDINKLETVLVECFCEANRLGVTDLAIPPVGTGGIGLQCGPVAKCLASAIDKFDKTNPAHLKKIKVYVFQANMLPDFQRELINPPAQSQTIFTRIRNAVFGPTATSTAPPTSKPASILPKNDSLATRESVSVLFCSWNANNVKKSFNAIQEFVGELSITKTIENETIEELTVEEQQELLSVTKKANVLIVQTSSTKLTIQGLQKNVLEAYSQANDIIHKFGQALQTSEYVTWKHVDPQNSTATDFSLASNHDLEKAFKKNEKGKTKVVMTLSGKKVQLRIDFSKMEAANTAANITYKLERSVASSLDSQLPATWEDMGGQQWKRVQVPANSTEYQTVLQKFQASMPINPVQMERIQNPTLWRQFQAQKGKIETKMPNKTVTRQLFHGTDGATCDQIIKHGFDRSYAGKHATVHGRGVYFAITAQYSNGYAKPNGQGNRSMFLADVVTGAYCRGSSATSVIPMQSDGSPFDSVVDDVNNPGMFVVFRDGSVYPTYILTYR